MFGHTGSWGLPDYGLTEAIGSFFGQGTNSQGGSNLVPDNYQSLANQAAKSFIPGYSAIIPAAQLTNNYLNQPNSNNNNNNNNNNNQNNILGVQQQNPGGSQTSGGNPQGSKIQAAKNSNPAFQNMSDQAILAALDQQNGLRNEISSGWDNYISQLNDIYNNGLGQQRSAQENIANSQYNQGVNSINAQKAKSLRDIANNTANAFQAGNIYLGAQGAGDSSAANQYSYALNKQAGKQTGDLNQFVSTQIQQLGSQRDQQINQIASWFADAQNQLKQAMANGQLSKSQDLANLSKDLLNRALAQVDQIKQNSQNQYNALLGWAASNSQNIGQLQQNIAGIPQAIGVPTIDSGGNYVVPTGYGANTNDQRQNQLFQNPSWFS